MEMKKDKRGKDGRFLKGHPAPKTAFGKGHIPHNIGGRFLVNCKNCGKEFLAYRYRINQGNGKFCSRHCCGVAKIIGQEATIEPIHTWIKRRKPKPTRCEHCRRKIGDGYKRIELANKDHKYNRNINDYMFLCTPCHRKYDIKHNGYSFSLNRSPNRK